MPRGIPSLHPPIMSEALNEATIALAQALAHVMGIHPRGNMSRVAERVVKAYLVSSSQLRFGSRMKPSTKEILAMEVNDIIEVEALSKQQLHGQFKTVRKKMNNPEMKFKCEQLRPGWWRIERRIDGSWNKYKAPERNHKALFLSELLLGDEGRVFPAKKAFDIISDFTKNKARQILKDNNAEWRAKTVLGGILVRRIR